MGWSLLKWWVSSEEKGGGGVGWLLTGSPENPVRTVGWNDDRKCTLCVHEGSLTGRGHSHLGADYSHELDNGAGVCVLI